MSLGLVLLVVEALAVYGLVFGAHAARARLTLVPYYVLLGVLAATLRWTTDAGIQYEYGPFTFILGSVVFFTAILFGVFLLYLFDGIQATQIGIYVVVAVSVVSPAAAMLFQFQLAQLDPDTASRILLSPVRLYVASTAAMVLDFLFLVMFWEFLGRQATRVPLLFRIAACLLCTYWLDTVLFCAGAFWDAPGFLSILKGNLISRAALTVLVSPILALYVAWEKDRNREQFTPRSIMAILHRSARREFDLFVARREIAVRREAEEALRQRDSILKSLAYAAERILNRSGDASSLADILHSLGSAAGVSRVRLAENTRGPAGEWRIAERFAWSAPHGGGGGGSRNWPAVSYGEAGLARWEATLARGEAIAGDTRTFPASEQDFLSTLGVSNILVLPLFVADCWWGFICFEADDPARPWPASEIDALRAAAGTLGAAIQRGRMERVLRESEERFQLALLGGDLGLWDWDIERDHVIYNDRWVRMLGYELSDIEPSSRYWEYLIHPDDYPRVGSLMRAHLKGETPFFEAELRLRARDGSWRWILSKGKVVSRDAGRRAVRLTGTHLDIQRLKDVEEALRYSQEMFRLMYESSPVGLVLCTMAGACVQANRAFLNIVGYSEAELCTRTHGDLMAPGLELARAALYQSLRNSGRYGPREAEYVQKNGARVPVLLNGFLVTGADGKQYIWTMVEDISDRKAAEEAIAEAEHYRHQVEARIEETLLRGRPPTGLRGVEIAVLNAPTEHMDGDFTDFVRINDRCFDVIVGDVMGKGILAALVSAGAKSHFLRAFSTLLAEDRAIPAPAALVGAVHNAITRQLIDLDCFLTLCYARFDLDAGTVTFVDCGHTKTVRYRGAEDAWTLLEGDNVPVGFLEMESYEERVVDLRPGDTFFFYSDGLTESRDATGSLFGVERLAEAIGLYGALDSEELAERVLETVRDYAGQSSNGDDKTCVVVKVEEPPEERVPAARFAIAGDMAELNRARAFLRAFLDTHALLLGGAEEYSRVILAYVEAVSNVIRHAFPAGTTGTITIELRAARNRLHISLSHDGVPFRPRATPLPDPGAKNEGGYGLYIMHRCFDRVGYRTSSSGPRGLVLVKHFGNLK